MKPLNPQFTYDQFQFRQLARDGDVVLLEKSKRGHARPSYEVVIAQHHPAQTIHGREYPERESLPPHESWGTLGWSFGDLASAQTRFHQLVSDSAKALPAPTPFSNDASQTTERLARADATPASPLEMPEVSLWG